jgi:hypothetical protein
MTYRTIDDRNSGGCYGEEELPSDYATESSEESELRNGTRRLPASRHGRSGTSRSRSDSDGLEELCW